MNREKIQKANELVLERVLKAEPVLVDILPAIDIIPGMTKKMILHAGPPIEWGRMCGPMQGAVVGALILEGLAKSQEEAYKLAESGEIQFDACHNHDAVAPMAGIISSSMPVLVVKNKTNGNYAYSNINEGPATVLRFGANDNKVIDKLRWMGEVLGPVMQATVRKMGEFNIMTMMAEALHMGDDLHNRFKACSALFASRFSSHVVDAIDDKDVARDVIAFFGNNSGSYLNLTMAAAKSCMDAGHGIEYSTIVTTMTRNGTDFGIRVSGLPDQWFTVPASIPKTLFATGFSVKDANPDMGDSAIIETYGLGGFAAAASPVIIQSVGGTSEEAVARTHDMYQITMAENPAFTIPQVGFRGIPTCIDILRIIETGIVPFIHTGVAHKKAGVGRVGAGVVQTSIEVFKDALRCYAKTYGI